MTTKMDKTIKTDMRGAYAISQRDACSLLLYRSELDGRIQVLVGKKVIFNGQDSTHAKLGFRGTAGERRGWFTGALKTLSDQKSLDAKTVKDTVSGYRIVYEGGGSLTFPGGKIEELDIPHDEQDAARKHVDETIEEGQFVKIRDEETDQAKDRVIDDEKLIEGSINDKNLTTTKMTALKEFYEELLLRDLSTSLQNGKDKLLHGNLLKKMELILVNSYKQGEKRQNGFFFSLAETAFLDILDAHCDDLFPDGFDEYLKMTNLVVEEEYKKQSVSENPGDSQIELSELKYLSPEEIDGCYSEPSYRSVPAFECSVIARMDPDEKIQQIIRGGIFSSINCNYQEQQKYIPHVAKFLRSLLLRSGQSDSLTETPSKEVPKSSRTWKASNGETPHFTHPNAKVPPPAATPDKEGSGKIWKASGKANPYVKPQGDTRKYPGFWKH